MYGGDRDRQSAPTPLLQSAAAVVRIGAGFGGGPDFPIVPEKPGRTPVRQPVDFALYIFL